MTLDTFWEEWKTHNKEKSKEIERFSLEISKAWPKSTLSKKEKRKVFEEIFISENFQMFKKTAEEILPKETFFSNGDLGILILSQIIAGRSITR